MAGALIKRLATLHLINERTPEILSLFGTITSASLAKWPRTDELEAARGERRMSTLTADGLPLEISVAMTRRGGAETLRYSTEATHPFVPPDARLGQADQVVASGLNGIGAIARGPLHRKLLAAVFPPGEAPKTRFLIWIGLAHLRNDDVLKIYYNLTPRRDADKIFRRWLDIIDRADCRLPLDLFLRLPAGGGESPVPAFVCLEIGRGGGLLKAKAYYRPSTYLERLPPTTLLGALGLGFLSEACTASEAAFHFGRNNHPAPQIFCIGLSSNGPQPSVNFYYDMPRHVPDDGAACKAISRVLHQAGLSRKLYLAILELVTSVSAPDTLLATAMRPQFHTVLALGFGPDGVKITPYLKPRWPEFTR